MNFIIAPHGLFKERVGNENYQFSQNVFQPASTLSPEQRAEFGVSELMKIPRPIYDPLTQDCVDSGTELIADIWTQVWSVTPRDITAVIATINALCRMQILEKFPIEKQLSYAQGLYPQAVRDACTQHINDCITESNRLTDCVIAASPVIPNWPI